MKSIYLFATICLSFIISNGISQTNVVLNPEKDNTMYQESVNLSNGIGQYIFAGNNANSFARRALVKFDVSSIPANATISAATFTMTCSKSTGIDSVFVHRVTKDWGEGTSNAPGQEGGGTAATTNDATWEFNFFNMVSSWTNLGGDFTNMVSARGATEEGSNISLASVNLIADVQAWVDGNNMNFGWALLGVETALQTALRFNSRENTSNPPTLSVTYTIPISPCATVDTLSGNIGTGVYNYNNQLATDGTVQSGAVVTINAKEVVNLFPNFEVEMNSDIQIQADSCQ